MFSHQIRLQVSLKKAWQEGIGRPSYTFAVCLQQQPCHDLAAATTAYGGLKNTTLLLLCTTCTINFAIKVVLDYSRPSICKRKQKVQKTVQQRTFYCLQQQYHSNQLGAAAALEAFASFPRCLRCTVSQKMQSLMLNTPLPLDFMRGPVVFLST